MASHTARIPHHRSHQIVAERPIRHLCLPFLRSLPPEELEQRRPHPRVSVLPVYWRRPRGSTVKSTLAWLEVQSDVSFRFKRRPVFVRVMSSLCVSPTINCRSEANESGGYIDRIFQVVAEYICMHSSELHDGAGCLGIGCRMLLALHRLTVPDTTLVPRLSLQTFHFIFRFGLHHNVIITTCSLKETAATMGTRSSSFNPRQRRRASSQAASYGYVKGRACIRAYCSRTS